MSAPRDWGPVDAPPAEQPRATYCSALCEMRGFVRSRREQEARILDLTGCLDAPVAFGRGGGR